MRTCRFRDCERQAARAWTMCKAHHSAGGSLKMDREKKGTGKAPRGNWPPEIDSIVALLQTACQESPDLLKPEYRYRVRAGANPLTGHCYVACEALRAILGPEYRPHTVRHEGGVHWFLRGPDGAVLDPTAAQFDTPPPYAEGRGRGFLTRDPSARARALLYRAGRIDCRRG